MTNNQRRPDHLGGEFGFQVGPQDEETTHWRVQLASQSGTWDIADEDRPHKAVAKLTRLITEAQEALQRLQAMGVYREDLPAYETPATGVPIHCPAQPCYWGTAWDTLEEAEAAQQRHVDEDHNGSRLPSQEWQDEAMRRWRDQRERGWAPISAFDWAGDQ